MTPQNEIVFVDVIFRWCETDSLVNRLGRAIVSFYVQSNAAHLFIDFSDRNDGIMQPSIDSFPSPGRIHIYTLNPPKSAVAPIAPFIGDHQLTKQPAIVALFEKHRTNLALARFQLLEVERSLS